MGRRTASRLTAAAATAALLLATALPAAAAPLTDDALAERLRPRIAQDRSGVCIVAAAIDGAHVARTRLCARPRADGGPGYADAFEIGSISKTMTAFLLADLIADAGWSLDDPLVRRLPSLPSAADGAGSAPQQGSRQILLRDVVTHSSGLPALPSRFGRSATTDPANPYASLTEADLLASLAEARPTGAIGQPSGYSNFAVMLLSLAVARGQAQQHPVTAPPTTSPITSPITSAPRQPTDPADLEHALTTRLFQPLQMRGAYIARPRADARPAQGHTGAGAPTPAWTWAAAPNAAGVGGVRATLDDMVRYAQALLGVHPAATAAPLAGRLQATQQPVAPGWGMQWARSSWRGHDLVAHDGGTGGFSSSLVLEPAKQRAVVVLADTALADMGGIGTAAWAVLEPDLPMPRARVAQPLPASLLAAAPGDYTLDSLQLRIWNDDGRLRAQVPGQAAMELLYDDHGDLYPRQGFALLRPVVEDGKLVRFSWHQGGGIAEGVRNGAGQDEKPASASNPLWQPWAGTYKLLPQFSLRVFERDGRLWVQGTAQPAVAAEVTGSDQITLQGVAATVQFRRNDKGDVTGLTLQQNGRALDGARE